MFCNEQGIYKNYASLIHYPMYVLLDTLAERVEIGMDNGMIMQLNVVLYTEFPLAWTYLIDTNDN